MKICENGETKVWPPVRTEPLSRAPTVSPRLTAARMPGLGPPDRVVGEVWWEDRLVMIASFR